MRLLTEDEMELYFGGDETIQSMDTITVTGSYVRSSGGHYIPGYGGFVQEETNGWSCSWCTAYYATLWRVIPEANVPTREKAKCLANATAQAGKGWRNNVGINLLNSRVYRDPSLTISASNLIHRNGQGLSLPLPAGYTQQVNAVTVMATSGFQGTVNVYAAGMEAGVLPPYTDPVTNQPGTLTGTTTIAETLVFTLGHELYHQHHPGQTQDESLANGWGVRALIKFRSGAGANCQ